MNAHTRLTMTKAEFRRWIEDQPEQNRYELVNGEPRMMVRVKRAHDTVVMNWIAALIQQLDRSKFAIHTGEFAVSTNDRSYRLPDVSVERFGGDPNACDMTDPVLLVEVLSPSTLQTDFNEKATEYLALPSLLAYAICAQDTQRVWLYCRGEAGWPSQPAMLKGPDDKVVVPALGISVMLTELYFGLNLPDE